MGSTTQTLFSLVEFDRCFLSPVVGHFNKASSNVWKTARFSESIAAYLWLELGIEVGYFPFRESASAVSQRLTPFFTYFEHHFKHYGYMFDPSVEVLLREALRTPFVHPSRPDVIAPSTASEAAFTSALGSEIGLVRSRYGETLAALLNFAPDQLKGVIKSDHALEDEVAGVFHRSAVEMGFAAIVQYMEALVRLSNLIVGDPDIPEMQRPRLERRIRQITRWRANRFDPAYDDGFLEVGRFIADQHDLDFQEIKPKLVTLLNAWGFTHTKFVTA